MAEKEKVTTIEEHYEIEKDMGPYRVLQPGEVVDPSQVVDLTNTTFDSKLISVRTERDGDDSNG